MFFGVHPLIALGVLASTAATDAAYVFFNAAVSGRQRTPIGAPSGTCSPPSRSSATPRTRSMCCSPRPAPGSAPSPRSAGSVAATRLRSRCATPRPERRAGQSAPAPRQNCNSAPNKCSLFVLEMAIPPAINLAMRNTNCWNESPMEEPVLSADEAPAIPRPLGRIRRRRAGSLKTTCNFRLRGTSRANS